MDIHAQLAILKAQMRECHDNPDWEEAQDRATRILRDTIKLLAEEYDPTIQKAIGEILALEDSTHFCYAAIAI